MRALRIAFGTVALLAYPALVYFGLERLPPRTFALAFVLVALVSLALRFEVAKKRDLAVVLRIPVVLVSLAGLSAWLDDPRFVMALPVLVNVALLHQFGSSLRGVPLVERFARLIDGELSPAQVRYCRTVTIVWCGFFVVNGSIAATLALVGTRSAWALYTGIFSYVLMGTLGGGEYLVRKAKFRKFDDHPVDRVLARIFPPPRASEG